MKTTWKISSSRAQIAIGVALLIAAFLILQIINGLEDLFAGKSTQFDWNQMIFEYPRVHWVSMVVRIGIVLAVVFWSRRTINALHKHQELVRQIPETVSDGIYLVDREGRMTFANSAVENILGLSRDVILQRTYEDATWNFTTLDGDPFPHQDQPFVRVMETGEPVQGVEQCVERTNGTRVIVSINASPIRDVDGHIVGEVGTMTDITERKRAEAALRNVERRYRLLFEGVSVMNVLTKPGEDGLPVIVDCNDLFAETLGYTRAEVVGRSAGEFYTAESNRKMREGGYQRALQGQLLTEERELLTKDGKVINALVSAVPDIDQNGKSVGTQAMYVDITQRKHAEEQLRRSEERYKNIVENASDIIYRTDPEGRLTFCNPTASRILIYTNEEFIGQSYLDFVHPSHRKDTRRFYHEQFEKKIPSTYYEFLAIAKDGSEHWIGQNVQMLKEGNEIVGFQAVARDITDRKRVEKALEEERLLLHTLLDNLPDYIYAKDTQCRFTMANAAMAHLQGAALPEDLVGKSDFDFLSEDVAERNCADDRAIMRSGEAVLGYQERNIDGDGKPRWVLTSKVPLRDTKGNVVGLVGISHDITEYHKAQEALQQSEERHRALLEGLPDSIWHMNRDGILLDYKPPRDMVPRLDLAQYIGKRIDQVKPFPATEQVLQHLNKVLAGGEPGTFEYQIPHNQNVYDRQARIVQSGADEALMIISDITDRKKVDRLKNEFISMVSHELRTPLTSIRGSLGLIAGGTAGAISAQAKSLVDIAYKNSERLILIINDILDIEKIESGKMVFELKPLELMPLLTQAIEANSGFGQQFGIEFTLTKTLPNVRVNADPDRLTQVITNLLSNAAKFSPRESKVDIGVSRYDSTVRVSIHDSGPGIPEEFQKLIFQKFAQADSSNTRKKGGSGLGLSISKAIVERLGGQIGFETAANAGTTFYFDLPEWHAQPMNLKPIPARKPRVLICEDDHDTAMLLKLMLEQSGYASEIAYDAAEAKELLFRNDYAGMTLDLVLPDKDGISLIRELRDYDKTRDLSIVVVSMSADKGKTELNGDAVQVIDWISKPIDAQRLLHAVKQAVARTGNHSARILHVEDDPDITQIVSVILSHIAQLDRAETLKSARQLLQENKYDLVILDLDMPDGSGVDLIPLLGENGQSVPAVIFSVEEVKKETAALVSATLVKSRTSNEKLVRTIQSLIQTPVAG